MNKGALADMDCPSTRYEEAKTGLYDRLGYVRLGWIRFVPLAHIQKKKCLVRLGWIRLGTPSWIGLVCVCVCSCQSERAREGDVDESSLVTERWCLDWVGVCVCGGVRERERGRCRLVECSVREVMPGGFLLTVCIKLLATSARGLKLLGTRV